jgi:hypothetical protein
MPGGRGRRGRVVDGRLDRLQRRGRFGARFGSFAEDEKTDLGVWAGYARPQTDVAIGGATESGSWTIGARRRRTSAGSADAPVAGLDRCAKPRNP